MVSLVNVSKHIKRKQYQQLHKFFQKIENSEILPSWFSDDYKMLANTIQGAQRVWGSS